MIATAEEQLKSNSELPDGRSRMALRVELKPNEKIIIGSCVITNSDKRAKLLIEGDRIPILREKDILTPATADTPAKLLYLAVQLMYLSPEPQSHHAVYFDVMRELLTAAPSSVDLIQEVNNHILAGEYYKALKSGQKLIEHEEHLLRQARALQKERKFAGAA
jgi:flagellar protein FlbT